LADLHVQVGELRLTTPVIAAAGTYGYGVEYDGLVDWTNVGGVAIKGLSFEPCSGLPPPRMVETPAGMLNAIGLQNIGVEAFVRDKLPHLRRLGPKVVANCWGDTPEEFARVVAALDEADGVDAIELNLGCPNKREWGKIFACDPVSTERIVSLARRATTKPLWAKLSPNVTDITEPARAAVEGGADALSLINTLRGMAIDASRRLPRLSNTTGGLSGPAIKPVGLWMVYSVSRVVRIPVIGAGGILSGEDVAEFLLAGASAVEVGTASLFDPAAPARISKELDAWLDRMGTERASDLIGALEEPVSC